MAVERRRGCGYRMVGGTYLVGEGIGVVCDRLPIRLDVCPVCSHGFKQSRGWQWVQLVGLVGGPHHKFLVTRDECDCFAACPLCKNPAVIGRAGLVWIGERFYKTPGEFMAEGREMGFSRRIQAMPRGFKVGETWVMLAHPKAIHVREDAPKVEPEQLTIPVTVEPVERVDKFIPGIFTLWRPARVEKLFNESERGSEEVTKAIESGITPIFIPDSDPDHHGTVYDKPEDDDVAEPVAAA